MPYRLLFSFNTGKALTVAVVSLFSVFAQVKILAIVAFLFVLIDFVLGIIVSIRVRKQGVLSSKIYKTVWKIIGIEVSICLAYLLDTVVLNNTTSFYLANVFTGIICGADFWSILTHFAILSDHPVFRLIKKWGKAEIENKVGALKDFDKELKNTEL
jgi:phage-related holin